MSDSKLQSLSEIFNNKIFRIPDFQRGYSWEERQLDDFWEDIQNLNSDKIHYIGLLTVEPIKSCDVQNVEKWKDDLWLLKKGMSAYYVIDGQQRLTTLIILLHEILRTFDDNEGINYGAKSEWIDRFLYRSYNQIYKSFVFGYEKDNPSDEFFKTKILEQDSSAADKYPETLYTANLMFAKNYFAKKLKMLNKEDKEEIFDKAVNWKYISVLGNAKNYGEKTVTLNALESCSYGFLRHTEESYMLTCKIVPRETYDTFGILLKSDKEASGCLFLEFDKAMQRVSFLNLPMGVDPFWVQSCQAVPPATEPGPDGVRVCEKTMQIEDGKAIDVKIIVDHDMIEAFIDEQIAFTYRIYAKPEFETGIIAQDSNVEFYNLSISGK